MRVTRSIWLLVVAALIAVIFGTDRVCAESSYYESEPNNTPAEANPIAGAITIVGDLGGQDQDAFMWSVSDVDVQKRRRKTGFKDRFLLLQNRHTCHPWQ